MSDISILSQIIVASATGLGAFGGFPDPPKIFKEMIQYELVKWILLAVLIWQGGGGASVSHTKDILVTVLITAIMYIGKRILDNIYESQKWNKKNKNC
jgi:hypothetical protein